MSNGFQSYSPPSPSRNRVSVEFSDSVSLLLDHISEVLGVPKSQLVAKAMLDQLQALVARSDALQERSNRIAQSRQAKAGKTR